MVQSSLKMMFSFVMVFSLLLPVAAPFCAEDWYKMVMMGGTNEEETQDHQKETTKKFNGKDLFFHDYLTFELTEKEEEFSEFAYQVHLEQVVFDIVLPPPEHIG